MARGRGASGKARKSRAKGRTAEEQLATALLRIEAARASGSVELNLGDLTKLEYLPPEVETLTALQSLSLTGRQVSNLSPIANLTTLQYLSLDHTRVSDLSPIAGLPALRYLSLDNTQVKDLLPIAGLKGLQHLSAVGTSVSDLSPVRSLTSLQELS
jgi:Leucine-rich repeat (LRR) protein